MQSNGHDFLINGANMLTPTNVRSTAPEAKSTTCEQAVQSRWSPIGSHVSVMQHLRNKRSSSNMVKQRCYVP
jgi:hypothetical protein